MSSNAQRDWFLNKLKDASRTSRELSRHLGMDPSALSRTLKGERQMKYDEAKGIAHFLDIELDEVLRAANLNSSNRRINSIVSLAFEIVASGELVPIANPKPVSDAVLERARSIIAQDRKVTMAAIINAQIGPLAYLDNAIVFYQPSAQIKFGPAIVKDSEDKQLLCNLRSTRHTGEATFLLPDGSEAENIIRSAYPVLAILP